MKLTFENTRQGFMKLTNDQVRIIVDALDQYPPDTNDFDTNMKSAQLQREFSRRLKVKE
jgi:hypothetical protein